MLVGVIPAAGHGTRLGLERGSKEMVRVGGRPVMDALVDRMRAAAPDEIRVVTRPDKTDVIEHAHRIGAHVVLGRPPDVSASLRLGIAGLDPGDEVLFGYPDTLWEPPDGFTRLLAELRAGAVAALGLFRTPDAARSDVVTVSGDGRVTAIAVKPEDPPSDLIWGCAAIHVKTLAGLADGEEPGAHLHTLAQRARVAGVWLSDAWIDIGTPEALRRVAG